MMILSDGECTLEEYLGRSSPKRFRMNPAQIEKIHAAVRRAGFLRACTNEGGDVARPGVDPFRLPRVVVGDWDVGEFECRLERWLTQAASTKAMGDGG